MGTTLSRDKGLALLGFLGVAATLGAVAAVVNLISALSHSDRWSGFIGMVLVLFGIGVAIAIVLKVMPPKQ